MLNEDTIQYAIENTSVILAPQRRIETFGSTSFHFFLVSELMDQVNQIRVRDGELHAERPMLLTPDHLRRMMLEGFGERAEEFIDWLEDHGKHFAVLKYGFQFRKTNVTESVIHSSLGDVVARLREKVENDSNSLSAIIQGVDEGWEVSLLKFASDLIQESAGDNLGDFRQRGLL